MDKLSSLSRFKASCPFLGRTKTSTLRSLCTSSSARFPSLSVLTERATKCPVMGPALNLRSKEIVAGYASIAAKADVDQIHKERGVIPPPGATIEMCPHASAARAAARMAEDLAAAARKKEKLDSAKQAKDVAGAAAAAGCPFHQKAAQSIAAAKTIVTPNGFDYESFYVNELEKKHKDKSYRYFNNINRLAAKFPTAHTANVQDEVDVWCANDYLGMGNNPVVLETMQYVPFFPVICHVLIRIPIFQVALLTNMVTVQAVPVTLLEMVLCTSVLSKSWPPCIVNLLLWSFPPAMSRMTTHSQSSALSSPAVSISLIP